MNVSKLREALEDLKSGDISVRVATTGRDAKRIAEFFLSEDSFDDRRFTKGEISQMNSLPYESLKDPSFLFWSAENEAREIIGVISVRENIQKSGGYFIDYIVVHKNCRKQGVASMLIDIVIKHVGMANGRYIHADTCDTEIYSGVRKLFKKKGFVEAGRFPNYYFEGEGLITYYLKML